MATPRYRLARRVVADLERIADYIGERNPAAADRVIHELFRTFDSLAVNPELGASMDDLRPGLRMIVPSSPAANYLIFYRIVSDGVSVSNVIHAARDWVALMSGRDG
jgi:toxin ParE1/3/4